MHHELVAFVYTKMNYQKTGLPVSENFHRCDKPLNLLINSGAVVCKVSKVFLMSCSPGSINTIVSMY